MRTFFLLIVILISTGYAQQDSVAIPKSNNLDLDLLLVEAMMNNPDIRAAQHQMEAMEAKIPQSSAIDPPTLEYMHEGFPDLNLSQAMYSRIKLMQMLPFPGKIATHETIAEIQAEHAHHDQFELINELITKLKSMYFELWNIQQDVLLIHENIRLMKQFSEIALANYSVGKSSQQDVLKSTVEISKLQNMGTDYRSKELGIKAMMMALLNRSPHDTLGYAFIPDSFSFTYSLDTLETLAMKNRQMLVHDSLYIIENETELSLAKKEYLPDFTFAVERMTSPLSDFKGWSFSAGISLPFAPWSIGKANSMIEEADINVKKANDNYNASKNMVLGGVQEHYAKITGLQTQLETYAKSIIPTARQSLNVSLSLYQNGKTDFLMLIDAFRTLIEIQTEFFTLRMQYEQSIAELGQIIGITNFVQQ